MQRKIFQTLLLICMILLLGAQPATASEVKIMLNGQPATFVNSYLERGITMISLNSFAKLSGAQIESLTANTLNISKNNINLALSLNETEAQLNGNTILLPTVPVKTAEEIFVPLRTLCNIFGYELKWDGATETIELTINETKDGMTPQELLVKTNQASQEIDTFSLDGSFTIDMEVTSGNEKQVTMSGLKTTMLGQIQNQPLQVHLIQTMELPTLPGQESSQMITETYMTEEKIYFKVPGQAWAVQDMPISPELWQQQRNIQSSLLDALNQGNALGGILSFSDDVIVNDKEYYVLNSAMNMDNFREAYEQIWQLVMGSMTSPSGDPEEFQQIVEQIMEGAKIDYYATTFINKQTFLCDLTKFDINLDLLIDLSQMANNEPAEVGTEIPETIQMKMKMKGEFEIKDVGEPFVAPDVKDAVPLPGN
ncbi:MAG: DUF6612 family protein [Zhaonellaceae bacterium]|jgi:hypothetical protein|nr:copper amine oxidase N-terminal domain-containing protein [Clostridia bacterium]